MYIIRERLWFLGLIFALLVTYGFWKDHTYLNIIMIDRQRNIFNRAINSWRETSNVSRSSLLNKRLETIRSTPTDMKEQVNSTKNEFKSSNESEQGVTFMGNSDQHNASSLDNRMKRLETIRSTPTDMKEQLNSTKNEFKSSNESEQGVTFMGNSDQHNASSLDNRMESEKYVLQTFDKYVFLKVHKAGSSTAQNIFLRFGITRNLTFILSKVRPKQYNNVISTKTSLNDENTQPPPPNKTFDISCCHVNYNREAFDKYIQGNVAYIGIVREPFSHFKSSIRYFRPSYIFYSSVVGDPVLRYLENPLAHEKSIPLEYSCTNNRMAFEFDFPRHLFTNYSFSESIKYLEKLDDEFVFVLVMEYFVESIVMMKRILKWSLKDILYLKKNENPETIRVQSKHEMLYKKFAKLDYDLYTHFHKRLWDRIKMEGTDFHQEVKYFDELNTNVEQFCMRDRHPSDMYTVSESPWSSAFNVTNKDCTYLMMHEIHFISIIRHQQYPDTDESHIYHTTSTVPRH